MSEQVEIRGTKWKLCSDGVWRTDKEFWGTPITDAIDEVIALRARVAELEKHCPPPIPEGAEMVRLLVEKSTSGCVYATPEVNFRSSVAKFRGIVEAWIPPVPQVPVVQGR